jgi:hypothetical protein
MKHEYLVTITRTWAVSVEADDEQEAKDLAYEEIDDGWGDFFDEVEIDDLDEDEEDTEEED